MKIYTVFLLMSVFLITSGCALNKNKQKDTEATPKLQAPISVGSVLTKFEVVEQENVELAKNQLQAKVLEVMGYGANTEIIGKDAILTLSFNDSEALSSLAEMKKGEIFQALITKSPPSLNSTSNNLAYRIIELKN